MVDLRTDGFTQLGKMYGTTPGFYLLVGPNWRGDIPTGIILILLQSVLFIRPSNSASGYIMIYVRTLWIAFLSSGVAS